MTHHFARVGRNGDRFAERVDEDQAVRRQHGAGPDHAVFTVVLVFPGAQLGHPQNAARTRVHADRFGIDGDRVEEVARDPRQIDPRDRGFPQTVAGTQIDGDDQARLTHRINAAAINDRARGDIRQAGGGFRAADGDDRFAPQQRSVIGAQSGKFTGRERGHDAAAVDRRGRAAQQDRRRRRPRVGPQLLAVVRCKSDDLVFDGGDEHASAADGGRGADRGLSRHAPKYLPVRGAHRQHFRGAQGRKNRVALNGDRAAVEVIVFFFLGRSFNAP